MKLSDRDVKFIILYTKLQGGNTAENWIKDLLSIAPPIRVRLSLPHSQYLPSGSFHKPLILKHQRPNRMKATIPEKKTKPKKLEKKKKN